MLQQIPASFSLQLNKGDLNLPLKQQRKLLNTEKLIFKNDDAGLENIKVWRFSCFNLFILLLVLRILVIAVLDIEWIICHADRGAGRSGGDIKWKGEENGHL